MYKIYNFGTI